MITKKDADVYCQCWNNRCVVLNSHLRKEIQAIRLEATSESIENYNKHVNACPINEGSELLERMSMCIKKVKVFRTNTKRSGKQDTRNLLLLS